MRSPAVARWLSVLFTVGATSVGVAACGGSGSSSGAGYRDASLDDSSLSLGEAGSSTCKAKTCQDLGYTCGKNSDTCGGIADCGTCSGTEYCGGGGYSKCGGNIGLAADGAAYCTPKTCADFPIGTCGIQSDSCGGLTATCGSTDASLCPVGQFCGGGGTSLCGTGVDGGATGEGGLCTPKTCADFAGATCGQQSDGCGGLTSACGSTDAGLCGSGQFCGGGGPGLCGTGATGDGGSSTGMCTPLTCANLGNPCGAQGDGCGGMTPVCTTCPSGQWCGGGGPNECGNGFLSSDDGGGEGGLIPPCVPKTCANFPAGTCGEQSDGCGGLTANCNSPCPSGQYCGGGGAGVCGTGIPSDAGVCTPWTCAHYPASACGEQSDGCGGLTANCNTTCPGGEYCGGGGAGLCGSGPKPDAGACTPKTCANFPGTCGEHSDGCGGLTANCATCVDPKFCGGGGPGVCGGNNNTSADGGTIVKCTPATCASLGYSCGLASDGCGGTIGPCGAACTLPLVCGGSGKPGICGSNLPCTGLCTQQVTCTGTATTTLTGTVVASTPAAYLPTGVLYGDPVPDVVVYIPTTTVAAFVPRASETTTQQCTTCGADVSGNPLVTTTTAYNGTFTLSNVPVGKSIPLVMQLGRWRRQFTVNITNSCGANQVNDPTMPAGILMMPNNQTVGDIPLTAISTGQVDAMECVLLKMGIDTSEFTTNAQTGRIHIYQGNGASASAATGTTPSEVALMGQAATRRTAAITGTWDSYDQMLFPCWGAAYTKTTTELANLITYADTGGHFFATHYSYTWLNTNGEFEGTANWDVGANANIDSTTGVVSPLPPTAHPAVFVDWLNYVQALSNYSSTATPPNPADVTITQARHDVDSVAGSSVSWITGTDPNPGGNSPATMLLHYTFDTPVTPPTGGQQCGHQIYSDFHVSDNSNTSGYAFPADATAECGTAPLTPQEKILEFMVWDLSSCVPPQTSASCTPLTCAAFPTGTCGQQGDGCGGLTANCGTCPTGETCGGAGIAAQCGAVDAGTCTAQTCATYPVGTCGQQADGCGGLTASCNDCATGQSCGGAGVAGVCGAPPSCTPKTCASFPTGTCGQQSDGCGGLTADCTCPTGQTCGGGGVSGQCATPPSSGTCTPLTCSAYPGICGQQSDGCGGLTVSCNPCTLPATCGGGGVSGQCGTPPDASSCVPQTCSGFPGVCGVQSDGCGGLTPYCNPCTAPATCGGGGTAGACGSPPTPTCTPLTCAAYPAGTCGQQSDGCGGLTADCNPCTSPQTCGGGGTGGQCGTPPVGSCVPMTCTNYPGVCGQQSDGCGGLTAFCNPCPTSQTCGGGGQPGVCGAGQPCTATTCTALGFNCGPAGDGCGGLLSCGTCPSGQTCGATSPGVCSGNVPQ
jgi:hypothetical protein